MKESLERNSKLLNFTNVSLGFSSSIPYFGNSSDNRNLNHFNQTFSNYNLLLPANRSESPLTDSNCLILERVTIPHLNQSFLIVQNPRKKHDVLIDNIITSKSFNVKWIIHPYLRRSTQTGQILRIHIISENIQTFVYFKISTLQYLPFSYFHSFLICYTKFQRIS